MDLLELARSIHADRLRAIEEESRRRRLLDRSDATPPASAARAATFRVADPGRARQGPVVGDPLAR
jgi:hypothetical protein